jgi:Arm DNA-binding domain
MRLAHDPRIGKVRRRDCGSTWRAPGRPRLAAEGRDARSLPRGAYGEAPFNGRSKNRCLKCTCPVPRCRAGRAFSCGDAASDEAITRRNGRQSDKLFARTVATAKPGRYGDGQGLWLVVSPNGARKWVFRFSFGGKVTETGLGPASTVSLAEARTKALEARNLLASGVNPIHARKAAKEAQDGAKTFAQVAESLSCREIARMAQRQALCAMGNDTQNLLPADREQAGCRDRHKRGAVSAATFVAVPA